jgi:Zn-finger nucleic acid-binding protein
MKCPACKTIELKPTKLDEGVLAHGCPQCEGALVSLLHYRDWAERSTPAEDAAPATLDEVGASESASALGCPKCAKLMTKFQISGRANNRLDLCGSCDEAWLDGGEWQLLKALELSHKMPQIFTEAWQRKVRQQASEEARRQRFARLAGEEAIQRADEIRAWLKDHPQRRELLFYIGHE